MPEFSEAARRLAKAAKQAGVLGINEGVEDLDYEPLEVPPGRFEPDEVLEELHAEEDAELIGHEQDAEDALLPSSVPLNRRQRELASLTEEELVTAYSQAQKRMEGLTPADANYARYKSYLDAIERFIDARQPEPEIDPEPPARRIQDLENDDSGLPWEDEGLPSFRNTQGLRFEFPGDTPES